MLSYDLIILSDGNISIKEFDKLNKDRDLEMTRMQDLNITIIPVVIGALVMIKKNTDTLINSIQGNSSLYEIQKVC